jgi:hypothetical protein
LDASGFLFSGFRVSAFGFSAVGGWPDAESVASIKTRKPPLIRKSMIALWHPASKAE